MNSNKYAISLAILLLSGSLSLAETQTPTASMGQMDMAAGKGMMHHGMGMMMGMSEEQQNEHLKAYQEHILKMHDFSNQILSEKDPVKKEQLKTKQLELMKEHHAQMMQHRMQSGMQHQKNLPKESGKTQ